jgi:putative transposase
LDFSGPGEPTDNALIEDFNRRLRQECLNENWFLSLEDAARRWNPGESIINRERPHGALGNLATPEYASLIK